MLGQLKIVAIAGLIVSLIGAIGIAYKRGEDAQALRTEVSGMKSQLERLQKDSQQIDVLQAANHDLSKELSDAQVKLSSIKDPTGCYTHPAPAAAVKQLFDTANSFRAKEGLAPIHQSAVHSSN